MSIEYVDKIIALLFSIMIFSNVFIIKKIFGSYFLPSSIFSIFWFLYTFLPLIFVWGVPISYVSVFYIYISIICFSFSTFIFNWKKAFIINKQKEKIDFNFNSRYMIINLYIFLFITILFLIINIIQQNINPLDFIFNFHQTSNHYLSLRYTDSINVSFVSKSINILNYFIIIIGTLIFLETKGNVKKIFYIFLTFIPSLFITLTMVSKGTILLSLFICFGTVLGNRIINNNFKIMNKQSIINLIMISFFILIILIISFISKGLLSSDGDSLKNVIYVFSSYAFSHLYGFSDWITYYLFDQSIMQYSDKDYHFGIYTFAGLFEILGQSTDLSIGVYTEYFNYNNIIESNIYTIFRGVILDFGFYGSFLFWFLIGFLFNLNFYFMLLLKKPQFSFVLYIFMITYFYQSFIISNLIWKSIFIYIIILPILLYFNKFKIKEKHEKN